MGRLMQDDEVTIPVFYNSRAIKEGDELVVFIEGCDQKKVGEKKTTTFVG